jgi:hypothetical protein
VTAVLLQAQQQRDVTECVCVCVCRRDRACVCVPPQGRDRACVCVPPQGRDRVCVCVPPQGRDRVCVCRRRFDKAQRELARATAIGVSLKLRRQVLEEAEALCGTVANMNKVRRHDCSCAYVT